MRLVTGGIMHETHTFASVPTTLDSFTVARGDQLWAYAGTNHSLGGVLDACRERGIDLVPTLFAHATPSGLVEREAFESLLDELVMRIEAALPADGIVLTLHGAMVADGYPDAEAEVVRRVRAIIGPELPVAVTLDLHANIGPEMVAGSTVVVGYDTYPHVDAAERAREAVSLLVATIEGQIQPAMMLVKTPLLPVPQAMYTERPPMKTLFERAFGLERTGAALSITIAGGFPYADVATAGMSVLAITDGDPAEAERIASEIAALAWSLREEFRVRNVPPKEAVAEAIGYPEGPVVLVDVGDNIGGGSSGDGTVLLAELLAQGAREATVVIADPEAVAAAFAVGVGGMVETTVGGKTDDLHGRPVPIRGRVRLLCDGEFVHEGPENAGVPASMGPTAVVRVEGINLVLTSRKTAPGDLQQLKSVGIDSEKQKIIVVKAAVRWRGGYASITKHSIDVDTPGLGSVDLSRFPFRCLRRPIYPLDEVVDPLYVRWTGSSTGYARRDPRAVKSSKPSVPHATPDESNQRRFSR
ncbi:M81 family metallopeptidase [Thermomicrobiaceae bacterium CFH 74404]|uniref:M81 family metallopeptidase n=1 Tax=Thermalbibacter longus TaxID=2951981 RepID=A0AA41W9E0_9BACT|nr:M81 family metallopeptidase [Thermalbibacter longus]MCM8748069.1 M81 family metallopeptidase [Thermalbibacter longus]